MSQDYLKTAETKMENNLKVFRSRVLKIRTGRANPALVEGVLVLYYGNQSKLSQMANISAPSARTLLIRPWDLKALKDIEQALVKANLGVAPLNDGKVIRLNLPDLTEERRKDLVKEVKKEAEKCRVDLRNNRRIINEDIKQAFKDKTLNEDQQKQLNTEVQKITDQFIQQVEKTVQIKEKEILEF